MTSLLLLAGRIIANSLEEYAKPILLYISEQSQCSCPDTTIISCYLHFSMQYIEMSGSDLDRETGRINFNVSQ